MSKAKAIVARPSHTPCSLDISILERVTVLDTMGSSPSARNGDFIGKGNPAKKITQQDSRNVALSVFSQWLAISVMLSLIFGGCCSNVRP